MKLNFKELIKLLLVVLAILSIFPANAHCVKQVTAEPINVWDSRERSYWAEVGNFNVFWSKDGYNSEFGILTISHEKDSFNYIWTSFPSEPFITASYKKLKHKENYGSFIIKEKSTRVNCSNQTVDFIEMIKPDILRISGKLTGSKCKATYTMDFSAPSSKRLRFSIHVSKNSANGEDPNRISMQWFKKPEDRIYGFGTQYTFLDHRGQVVPILSQEQGQGRGLQPMTKLLNLYSPGVAGTSHTTYASAPHYLTSEKKSFFLENTEYSVFDLRDENRLKLNLFSNHLAGQIVYGETHLDLIEEYTTYCGRLKTIPRWFHKGAILGIMGGTRKVREIKKLVDRFETPVSSFWLQDWVGQRDTSLGKRLWWNWDADFKLYPGWHDLLKELNEDGIEVLGYINPFLTEITSKTNHSHNYLEEARQKDYLVKNRDGTPHCSDSFDFCGYMIDLTNPEAREWYKTIIKEVLIKQMGMRGWMADFGEALPLDAQLRSRTDARSYHNKYPVEWAKLNREAIQESSRADSVFFVRAGFTKSPKYATLFWLGDQLVTWDHYDGIKTTVTALISSGLSGYSINHSDIGGYTYVNNKFVTLERSQELLLRWIELNAFTPIFRTHEGNKPFLGYQVYSDIPTFEFFSKFSKIFANLVDYREELFLEAQNKGYPVVRHPLLHFPDDPVVKDLEYEFMLGSEFIIAPVLDPNVNTKELYLPQGEWIHLWSGRDYGSLIGGQWIEVEAEIGHPPVFFKKGSKHGRNLMNYIHETGIEKPFEGPLNLSSTDPLISH